VYVMSDAVAARNYRDLTIDTVWGDCQAELLNTPGVDTHWNILGVIVRHIDVNVNVGGVQRRVQISMNRRDIDVATSRFLDLEDFLNTNSHGRMSATMNILTVSTPLTQMTQTTTTAGSVGYAPRPHHINDLLASYVDVSAFDHIMVFLRPKLNSVPFSVPTGWAGIYQGLLNGVHYSQVVFSANANCTWHTNAIFAERVLVHEFMHGLERASRDRGITIPSSIDAPRHLYGYGSSRAEHFRFYFDFLNGNILSPCGNGSRIGLTQKSFIRFRD